ncbi:hypothetical protein ACE7GA_01260 [Roseomonas sp. CCTCC AB2023176]|uniref:hypothetical protein n=1 Tax=Roseomonas sp. CCTCC AB2023176 TaxID=3342640 RepID=UPI0035DAF73A
MPEVEVLTVSHSGTTQDAVLATRLAPEAGARTTVLTNVGRSAIPRRAEVVLHPKVRATRLRTEAMTGRIGSSRSWMRSSPWWLTPIFVPRSRASVGGARSWP